ncbi:MAG: hypothetical protein WCO06_01620 [Candidatus Roizmanbacteria bacterium]
MGKIRTRIIGLEDIEKAQKDDQKKRSAEKKAEKSEEVDVESEVETKVKAKKSKSETQKSEETSLQKKKIVGKKHKASLKKVDLKNIYTLKDSLEILKKIKWADFDESVELHINVDETGIKGEVEMPHTTGKSVRVKIVDDVTLENIEKGIIDFDVLIAHPSYMAKLAKFAKVLGPKGLMPNPKAGTVSPTPEAVAEKFTKGTIRWRSEPKFPLVHLMVGKISHEPSNIVENAVAIIKSVGKAHTQSVFIKTTMSPGLKVDLQTIFG